MEQGGPWVRGIAASIGRILLWRPSTEGHVGRSGPGSCLCSRSWGHGEGVRGVVDHIVNGSHALANGASDGGTGNGCDLLEESVELGAEDARGWLHGVKSPATLLLEGGGGGASVGGAGRGGGDLKA